MEQIKMRESRLTKKGKSPVRNPQNIWKERIPMKRIKYFMMVERKIQKCETKTGCL